MFTRVRLLFRTFTPVEERILSEVVPLLPPAARIKYTKQMSAINKVQRPLDWTEINFYSMRRGSVAWEESLLFESKAEVKVAQIDFALEGINFRSTLFAVSGHIYSLVIRPTIKPYCFRSVTQIIRAQLINNPEQENPTEASARNYPPSYLDWLASPQTQQLNGWQVQTLGETYRLSLTCGDFLVLAMREGQEYLLASDDSNDPNIYYMATHDSAPVSMGSDFSKAFNS